MAINQKYFSYYCPMKEVPDTEKWVNTPPRELIRDFPNYRHLKVYSPSMNRETGCSLFLPRCYDHDHNRRFPVIYMLHGGYGNETTCPGITYPTFREIMDDLNTPAIVVYPNGGALSDFCDRKASRSRGETSVIKEVLPYIDGHFRTLPSRAHRAVIGYSAGCYGAQKFFFKYPDLFTACIGFGGGAHNYDVTNNAFILEGLKRKFGGDPAYLRRNNVYRFIVMNRAFIQDRPYYIRLVCGENDFMLENAGYFESFLHDHGYEADVTIVDGIGHSLEKLWGRAGAESVRIALEWIGTA